MAVELGMFGGDEPQTKFIEDIGAVADLPEKAINDAITEIFEDEPFPILDDETRSDVELTLAEHEVSTEDQESFFRLVRVIARQTAKYDLSEADLRDDIRKLDIEISKFEILIEEVMENREDIRTILSHFSRRNGLPRLRDVRWQVSADEATGLVYYLNERRGQVTLLLEDSLTEDQQTITFEVPEDESHILTQMISDMQNLKDLLER